MTATEIAQAYVALTVKAPGIKRDIGDAIGSAEPAFTKAGKTAGSKFMSAVSGVAKTGMAVMGGLAAVGLGTALTKGFERLKSIDEARAKLTGLGNDTKSVDAIMQNALASVKGTAFGLGDAATVAAQVVAAGIEPGQQLEGVLKSVANSAAAAGTDLGDMGSIFAKVASIGKAQNDVLQQVADRGIPIYQKLAEQFGVTTDEVFKMASAGEIGFAEFQSAMTSATGNVAEEMGNTFQGRLDNMFAALGRLGEGLLSGIFPKMKGGLAGITDALDDLIPAAQTVGTVIAAVFTFIADNVSWLGPLAAGLGVATVAVWALNAAMSANPIGLVITAIGLLIGGIVALAMNWDAVVAWISDVWGGFIGWITGVIDGFVGWWNGIWSAVGAWISDVWNGIVNWVTTAINRVQTIIRVVVLAIQSIWNNIWTGIGNFFKGIWDGIVAAVENIGDVFRDVFNGIRGFIITAFKGVVGIIKAPINGIIALVNGAIGGLNSLSVSIPDWVPFVGGQTWGLSIPKIPMLAQGGIVSASTGGTLAVIGEGGRDEAVVPLPPGWRRDGLGAGGARIDSSDMDLLAAKVAAALLSVRRADAQAELLAAARGVR